MGLFSKTVKVGAGRGLPEPVARTAPVPAELRQLDKVRDVEDRRAKTKTGRTALYAVRTREDFKHEITGLQAEMTLERRKSGGKGKVTEGEILELMLEAFKAARRNGEASSSAVPLANDIWDGVHAIAKRTKKSPAEVVETLVVERVAELGLIPRKAG